MRALFSAFVIGIAGALVSGCVGTPSLSEACLESVAQGKAQRGECRILRNQPKTASAIGDRLLAMGEGVDFQSRDLAVGKSSGAAIAQLRREGFFEGPWPSHMKYAPLPSTSSVKLFRAEWGTLVCNMGAEVEVGIDGAGNLTMVKGDVFERGCL